MYKRKELHIFLLFSQKAPRCLPSNEWPAIDFREHRTCRQLFIHEELQGGHSCEVVVSLDV